MKGIGWWWEGVLVGETMLKVGSGNSNLLLVTVLMFSKMVLTCNKIAQHTNELNVTCILSDLNY